MNRVDLAMALAAAAFGFSVASTSAQTAEPIRPVSLIMLEASCVDQGGGVLGGACALTQFSADDLTARYVHSPVRGKPDEKCTAAFINLPADLNVVYYGEDGVGQLKQPDQQVVQNVCELVASYVPLAP